ncbi:hypothetical protein G9P44_004747 [Scheffersomyces stipitis]|nr:hypothetical protein G9P44_004747 [Scheffersomyces stipitis]
MDNRSISSLSSSGSNEDLQNDPVQLEDSRTSLSRRPSLFRRMSAATTGYLSFDSSSEGERRQNMIREEGNDYLELNSIHTDDWFGSDQLKKSFSKKKVLDEEEEDLEEFPQSFGGESQQISNKNSRTEVQDGEGVEALPVVTRRRSTVASTFQAITKKLGFWDKEFHEERINIVLTFANNYLFLVVGFTVALCIYWGSYYNRASRYKNLRFAVVNADTQVGELPAIVGPIVANYFNLTSIQSLGSFDIWDFERISTLAISHNNTITEEVYRQVHHQKYWAAFYIRPNSTLDWVSAMEAESTAFSPAVLLEAIYETGRDFNAVNLYISSIVNQIIRYYNAYIQQTPLVEDLLSTLNSTQQVNVISNAPGLLTTPPTFVINDRLPVSNQIVQAPFQIGLIYLVIFSFFQFIFQIKMHMYMATKLKGFKYVAYRMVASQIAYLVLSLAFVTLNTAFGLKYNTTFGRSGFLVIWSFGYLTLSSLGSIIEVVALILFAVKPQLIGFLLLFTAVVNLSPTVSPIVLCPDFYRYGYGIPVRNAYELMQVAYFDSWKGRMGRNIGVLLTWIVVTNVAMPFVMKWMANKKSAADAKAAAEAAAQKTVKS